ncbi:MAG: autorepressor SdpR family transcription factor [Sandaracinaceae bacterium]|nr:autorepressor SdpR family transcription factor [Sandaracinaceae bacterium]
MRTQEVFKALSDPTRRRILKLLQSGSLSAGEIAEHFPITKGSLSHHFNVLKAADLLRVERRGQSLVYSLNTTVFEDVAAMLLELFATEASRDRASGAGSPRTVEPGPSPERRRKP